MKRPPCLLLVLTLGSLLANCSGGASAPSVPTLPAAATSVQTSLAPESAVASDRVAAAVVAPDAGAADVVALNAGGTNEGSFLSDRDFSGGFTFVGKTTHAIDLSGVANPGPVAVYADNRIGSSFAYTIGGLAKNAPYDVRLSFTELYWSHAGMRLFDVSLGRSRVLASFDIFAAAGAQFKTVTETFATTSNANSQIVIALTALKDKAAIGAIEIANAGASPGPSPSPDPSPVPSGFIAASRMNPATICEHFASSPMCKQLPANPNVSSSSSQWAALEFQPGRNYFGGPVQTNEADLFHDTHDTSEPLESVTPNVTTIAQIIDCNLVSYGPADCARFGLENARLDVPAKMVPEGNHDHHFTFDSTTAGGEYDFWLANVPTTPGAVMHVGTAGFCKWGHDGTGCSNSTATKIVTSMGGLDPVSIEAAEESSNGTLGYALSSTALCAAPSWVYPATDSDGRNTDGTPACARNTAAGRRPPEGTRWFLNVSDDTVNGLKIPAYAKVILRTADREHFGGVIVDTNWPGAPGLSLSFHRGDYSSIAAEAHLKYAPDISIPIATGALDIEKTVQFCANGTC